MWCLFAHRLIFLGNPNKMYTVEEGRERHRNNRFLMVMCILKSGAACVIGTLAGFKFVLNLYEDEKWRNMSEWG